jgi:hypothetical protein
VTQTLTATGCRSANRAVAFAVGGAYLAAGVGGGAVALGAAMAPGGGPSSALGAGWVAVYLCVGAVLVAAGASGFARRANTALGAAYLLANAPLLVTGVCPGLFSLNHPVGLLHLSSAAVLLGFGRTQD